MKDFLKYVGATIVGLIMFFVVITLFGLMSIVGMVASSDAAQKVEDNSVLILKLDGNMQEQATESIKDELMGTQGLALDETLSAIKKAKANENVKGIYMEMGSLGADFAQLEEIRNALVDFKKSGKWIVTYGDTYSQGCYYLATTADKIYMNPQGTVDWHGIGGQMVFLKDAYAKVGIKMIPFKCGKYKSATEIYTEDKMSQPSREQTERYVNGWWNAICEAVSRSRHISKDSLNAYADRYIGLEDPANMVKYKFVDGLLYSDQVKASVKKLLKLDDDATIHQISVSGMVNTTDNSEGEAVAVYYAYGDIVDDAQEASSLWGEHQIVGKDVCKDLADLTDDDDIKAVVIRVNSGGGSAYASEQIWHQVQLLKAKKPVVISMGGAAASGGYYISCPASYIYAEPTTITGSIGIFGIAMDRSELMTQKLGFKYDEVKTNRNATMGSEVMPMTEEQKRYLQTAIDRGYNLFKTRVANGRRLTMDQVEALAQGHVYLGSDAMKLKLVDALGGLDQAVAKAAQLAKLKEYHTTSYPGPTSIWDNIIDSGDQSDNALQEMLRSTLGDYYEPFMLMRQARSQAGIQARMPFIIGMR
jgi:protease-4